MLKIKKEELEMIAAHEKDVKPKVLIGEG